jgi:hypothetical protein
MVDRPETRRRDGSGEKISTTEARQAVTGTGTRYVLHIGLALAVLALVIIYFAMLR